MNTILYIVSYDGYEFPYGSMRYLVGIFDDKEKAETAAEHVRLELNARDTRIDVSIEEIPLNKEYHRMQDEWIGWVTDVCLGGHFE